MRRSLASVCALALLASCSAFEKRELPPAGQIILFVDTDTVVPLDVSETPDETVPGPLFDRLRVELYDPDAASPCADCTREFPVSRRAFLEHNVSVGVVPKPGVSGYRARVILYRGFGAQSIGARPASTIEAVVALPVVLSEGIVKASVTLRTTDVAKPTGTLDAPVTPVVGEPPPSSADSFARDLRKPCNGAPASDGEVCIPGGAYWLGDLTASVPSEQIAVVAPFFVDTMEVTVARVRASPLLAAAVAAGDVKLNAEDPDCTYSSSPEKRETFPLTCVRRAFAEKFCAAQNGRLMSELEFAYVASGRIGSTFVWGDDPPACADAVFGRGLASQPAGDRVCAAVGTGPSDVAKGQRDILTLRAGRVFDLGGSVAEWMRDDYQPLTGTCWTSPILLNTVCVDAGKHQSTRGGSWNVAGAYLWAVERAKLDAVGIDTGFRCARPAL